jgi:hypothetical protein
MAVLGKNTPKSWGGEEKIGFLSERRRLAQKKTPGGDPGVHQIAEG